MEHMVVAVDGTIRASNTGSKMELHQKNHILIRDQVFGVLHANIRAMLMLLFLAYKMLLNTQNKNLP